MVWMCGSRMGEPADNGASKASLPLELEEQYNHHPDGIYKGRKGCSPKDYSRNGMVHHDFQGRFAFRSGKWKLIPSKTPKKNALYDMAAFLPRLIELGLDVYDVVQPTTPQMDIAVLAEKYGNNLLFCGTVCVQSTLAFGTPSDVEYEVKRRLEIFKDSGIFLDPTHAIQVGSPLENILALYRTAGSLTEKEDIGEEILSIEGEADEDKINISKLF